MTLRKGSLQHRCCSTAVAVSAQALSAWGKYPAQTSETLDPAQSFIACHSFMFICFVNYYRAHYQYIQHLTIDVHITDSINNKTLRVVLGHLISPRRCVTFIFFFASMPQCGILGYSGLGHGSAYSCHIAPRARQYLLDCKNSIGSSSDGPQTTMFPF